MLPSPLAVAVYAAVKVAGYGAFAHGLNRVGTERVSPYKFAAAKTALGLVGGITYVFLIAPAIGLQDGSDFRIWLGAMPIRLLVWSVVLAWFYGFRRQPILISVAVLAGTVWSYALDGLMSLFYRFLPGMDMPFC